MQRVFTAGVKIPEVGGLLTLDKMLEAQNLKEHDSNRAVKLQQHTTHTFTSSHASPNTAHCSCIICFPCPYISALEGLLPKTQVFLC